MQSAVTDAMNNLFTTESVAQEPTNEGENIDFKGGIAGALDPDKDGQILETEDVQNENKDDSFEQDFEQNENQADKINQNENNTEEQEKNNQQYNDTTNQTQNSDENNTRPPPIQPPPGSPRNTARRSPKNVARQVDDAEVQKVCDEAKAGRAISTKDPHVIAAAIVELENERNDLMASGRLRESLSIQKSIDNTKSAVLTAQKLEAKDRYLEDIQAKRKAAKEDYDLLTKEIDTAEKEFSLKCNESIAALQDKQQKELDAYDEEWKNEAKYRQYNRLSSKLRAMKHQADLLIRAMRLDEADQVVKLAEQQEKIETQANSQLMLNDFIAGRRKLEDRQFQEMETLKRALEGKRSEMRSFFEKKKIILENRFKYLDNEEKQGQDPEHCWVNHRNDASIVSAHRTARGGNASSQAMTRSLAPKNYGTLSLPPLQVPNSARTQRKQ